MVGKRLFSVVVAAAAFACASGGASGSSSGVAKRDSNLITADEIAASHETNAYEAISRLRPLYLKTRGRGTLSVEGSDYATVFLDNQAYGDLNTLKTINSEQIKQIRWYSGPDAVQKFGMQYGSGVIAVETR